MKNLNATAFLNELYALASRGFKFTALTGALPVEVRKNENGDYDLDHGVFGVMEHMFTERSGRDDTDQIRGQFLLTHGSEELKRKMRGRRHIGGGDFYGGRLW